MESLLNPQCRFCTLPEPWRIIHESSNFVAQMGLGPLVEGYALILTRTHLSCFSELTPDQMGEFLQVLELIQRAQRKEYQHSLFFEHGRSGACVPEGHGEDLCYHAHLHLVPTEIDLAGLVSADFDLEQLSGWRDVVESYQKDPRPYILIQSGPRIKVVRTAYGIPRRYLRTKLAAALGEPVLADWVAFPSYAVVEKGLSKLRAAITSVGSG